MIRDVEYWQFEPEGQYLDRKSASKSPSELLRHLVAFANAEGGYLVVGIEDEKKNNIITGFKQPKAHRIEDFYKIARDIRSNILHLEFEEIPVVNYEGNDDVILIISVDISKNKVITMPNDDVYLRQGDESIKLSFEQRNRLAYDKGQQFFEDEIVEDARIEDIDFELVEQYRRLMSIEDSTVEQVLKARRFFKGNSITKAGILLFGKMPSMFFPQARVRFIRFDGDVMEPGKKFNAVKDVTFDEPIPKLIPHLKEFVMTQLRDFQYLDSDGKFKVVSEYPEFAWLEGIVNAITHRDYTVYGDYIKIFMYNNRIEIYSPGKLPNFVTIENMQEERFSRNPKIARTLAEFGWVRELNEGVKRIYSEMNNFFLKPPIYSEPGNKVLLVLENNILNRHFIIEENLEKRVLNFKNLSTDERVIIHYMYNTNEKMTTSKAASLISRSRNYSSKLLKKLLQEDILKWYGLNKNDSNQYYLLNIPNN